MELSNQKLAESDITHANIQRHTFDKHQRVRLINGLTGDCISWPGVATKENGWTVPGKFTVGDIVNSYCHCIKNDEYSLEEDGTKKVVKISGVMLRSGLHIAQHDLPLAHCAAGQNVTTICGSSPLEPPPIMCEEKKNALTCQELSPHQRPRRREYGSTA